MNFIKNNFDKICILVLCIVIVSFGISIHSRIEAFDKRVTNLEQRIQNNHDAEVKLLKQLEELNERTKQIKISQEKHKKALEEAKEGLSIYSDLDAGEKVSLNADDMNRIIDGWTSHIAEDSILRGHGEAFIVASRETGLDPVYLLAHAIIESGSGTSYLARTRYNFFGINAVDTNPDLAYTMGDGVDQGIIAGAYWIKSNFYDNGYTSLYEMANGGYATSPRWASDIASVYNDAINYL